MIRATQDPLMQPQDLDAEQAVIGSVLLLPEVLDDLADVIRPDDFRGIDNAAIFAELTAMHDAGERIDAMLLIARLKASGVLTDDKGDRSASLVTAAVECVPTAAHAVYYARIVRDAATRRAMIDAGTRIVQDGHHGDGPTDALLSAAEASVLSIRESRGTSHVAPIGDVLTEALASIERRIAGGGPPGLSTGFPDLDRLVTLRPGELVVVAGRPGMGKSALALRTAEYLALDRRVVLFVSLEMSRLELAERMLFSRARVDSRGQSYSASDQREIMEASGDLSAVSLLVDDSPDLTLSQIAAAARRTKRRDGLDCLVIDYLQLVTPDNAKEPRQEQVAKISRGLKKLARELSVPVIVLAQLNREVEKAGVTPEAKRPKLSHLRESGAIEQDADAVLFVHRDEYYATDDRQRDQYAGKALVLVAKHRNGPTGMVPLTWLAHCTRFESTAQEPRGTEWNPGEWTWND